MSDRPRHIVVRLAPGCPPAWASIDGKRFPRPQDLNWFTREVLPGVRITARPNGAVVDQGALGRAEIWRVEAPGWAHDQQAGVWTLRTDDDVEVGSVSDDLILRCEDRDSLARQLGRRYGSVPAVLI